MIRNLLSGALLLGACTLVGCGNHDRDPAAATTSTGIVGQLTEDPDDEVTPELQQQVADALARGETDEPLEIQ